jgi:predicted ATPase/signal transduction histidine kinase/GAF domain-containing protein
MAVSSPGHRAEPVLGDFRVVARLHASRRSVVLRARRLASDEPVVLKANGPDVAPEQALARYEHERAMLQSLHSDFVIKAYEIVRAGQLAALVLEDCGGDSLRQCLSRGALSIDDGLDIALRSAQALSDVHEAGIFHRDINPQNIVYNRDSRALKIIDFDIATTFRMATRGFAPGALAGTLRYMAPEQTGRMNRTADQRADLYSLGMTFYEIFTGRLPHDSDEPVAVVHFHLAVEAIPPERINPSVPPVLSDLILKLLAKAPEDRYQTAAGLWADLDIMVTQHRGTSRIERFPLATQDHSSQFEVSTRLYGREAETQTLLDAFARSVKGGVETVLLTGPSGVGKTALVLQLSDILAKQQGYLLKGAFDERRRDVPYSGVVEAFEDLSAQLLAETELDRERWRELILRATQPNTGVVVEAVPSLERLLGPQPVLPRLDSAGSQKRFNLTMQRFIQVFTRKSHPLVLFLDEAQWIDAASLTLLQALGTSANTESLLLVAAFQGNEVDDSRPLRETVLHERRAGHVVAIDLGPLGPSHVAELLADALHRDRLSVERLADLVWRKTEGNPFFIRQFLQALHEQGHIVFDQASRRFELDIASIEHAPITENVAELLANKMRKLPAETQRLLPLAAAIGRTFDMRTLAAVAELPITAAHRALEPAMLEEMVIPVSEPQYDAPGDGGGTANVFFGRFAFQHERIQQAAYADLPAEAEAPLHLAIGRILQKNQSAADLDERIFEMVGHLNRGSALMTDPEERAGLAALNLRAGGKARRSAAHAVATAHFRCAAALCGWSDDHALSHEAHLRLAESLYLASDFGGALEVADETAQHSISNLEHAEADALQSTIYLNRGDIQQSLVCTRKAARALGLEIPEDAGQFPHQLRLTMDEIFERLGPAPIESLLELPVTRDPEQLVLMRALMMAMPAAYMTGPSLFALFSAKMVLLSLHRGNCPESAAGYCGFAVVLHAIGQESQGYRFGKLGVAVSQRLDDAGVRATVRFQFSVFSAIWGEPLAHSLPHLRQALQLGLEAGDHAISGYSSALIVIHGLLLGAPLAPLLEEADRNHTLISELGEVIASRMLGLLCQLVRGYRGELADPLVLDGNGVTEAELVRTTMESGNPTDQFWVNQHRTEHRYFTGQFEAARLMAEASAALLSTVPGSLAAPLNRYYHSLVLTALWEQASPEDRAAWREQLAVNQLQMQRWSELRPENFHAMYLLVEAEQARVGLTSVDAVDLYDRAIAAAADQGLTKIEAMASELAGGYWLGRRKRPLALVYLGRARDLYAHWGASYKVEELELANPELEPGGREPFETVSSSVSAQHASEALDLVSVVRASQAVSGEVLLDRLLGVMMEIILKNAGAQGGALLLETNGVLLVQASKRAEVAAITVMTGLPLAEAEWLPEAIIEHVAQTGDSVVLDDAPRDTRFGDDPDVRARRPPSILCMPIVHKARLQGVLYLENSLMRGAFTRARLEGLTILVSQLAVSLENASLFATQKRQGEDLARMNDGLRTEITVRQSAERELASYRDQLEERVVSRTRELEESREEYRQMVESTKTVPFSYSPSSGRFSYVGPQAERLFGFPTDCWNRPNFLEQLIPGDRLEWTRAQLASGAVGDQREFEGPARTADERTLQLRWVVTCGEAAGERSLRGLILDVTERWRLESELAQAQKLESVGRLAAGVAHEINTPIQFVSDSVNFVRGSMTGLFEVLNLYQALPGLLNDPDALQAAARKAMDAEEANDVSYILENAPGALGRALEGLERVASIVRAMKQFAYPDRKEKSHVDLNLALQSTLTIAGSEYKYVAELDTDFGDIPLVLCHAGEINQAVLNIIVNAAHAIADAVKNTDRRGKITVRTCRHEDLVEIAIGDTGRGIPEGIRQRIFDPFFTTKEVGRGTGQGLAIARNIIADKHGGTLHFDTEAGQGTTFFIRLPVGEDGASSLSAPDLR